MTTPDGEWPDWLADLEEPAASAGGEQSGPQTQPEQPAQTESEAPAEPEPRQPEPQQPEPEEPTGSEPEEPATIDVRYAAAAAPLDRPSPRRSAPITDAWRRRVEVVAAALAAAVILLEAGVIYGGLGAPAAEGSALARIGVAGYTDLGIAPGLVLLAAAGMAAWTTGGRWRRLTLVAALGSAGLLVLLVVVAAWGEVASEHHQHVAVALALRRQLATFVVVSEIPAVLAGAVAWWGWRDPPR